MIPRNFQRRVSGHGLVRATSRSILFNLALIASSLRYDLRGDRCFALIGNDRRYMMRALASGWTGLERRVTRFHNP